MNIRYGAHARCSRRNNPCQDVSLHGKSGSVGAPNALCPQPEACPTHCQAHNALQVAPAGGPHNEALVTNLKRVTKLLYITPALLQSSDGRCSRQGRYNEYARGELTGLIDWLVVFTGRSRQKAREDTPEARQIRASKLAHQRGGITKAASKLISPPAAPRDSRKLATLRGKHSTESPAAIATGKAQVERRAGITAVGEQEQQPNVTSEPLDAQGQIPEMENLFEEATVKVAIKKANPQSAAGPSGSAGCAVR